MSSALVYFQIIFKFLKKNFNYNFQKIAQLIKLVTLEI